MNRKTIFAVAGLNLATILVVALLLPLTLARANPSVPQAGAPSLVAYQGYLVDGSGVPLAKPDTLTVGVYAEATGGTALWESAFSSTQFEYGDGYFTVLLPLDAGKFSDTTTWLQVEADGVVLPRQQIAAVPYALQAQAAASAPWSGLSGIPAGFADGTDNDTNTTYTAGDGLALSGTQFRMQGTAYDNVIVVAKSGGDYTTVQAAIDSISDSSATNPYLIRIEPGIYTEQVVLNKPYVYLEGSGTGSTVIQSATAGSDVATAAVVRVTDAGDYGWIKDLTIKHTATSGTYAVGLYTAGRWIGILGVEINLQSTVANFVYGVYNTGADAIASARETGVQHNSSNTSPLTYAWSTQAGAKSYLMRCAIGAADYAFLNRDAGELNFRFGVASGVIDNGAGFTARLLFSELTGGTTINNGSLTCAGTFDESAWRDTGCP
ncbi:MAG: pectinesterase family protein [Chloroflexota bacterium]